MKTAEENRRLRLSLLVEVADSQKVVAELLECAPTQVGQYTGGHREIGPKFARRVEEKLGLGRGWMDQPLPPTKPEPNLSLSPADRLRAIAIRTGLREAIDEMDERKASRGLAGWFDPAHETEETPNLRNEFLTVDASESGKNTGGELHRAMKAIGSALAAVDELTRAQAGLVLQALVAGPQQAEQLADRLQATLSAGRQVPGHAPSVVDRVLQEKLNIETRDIIQQETPTSEGPTNV